MTFALPLLLALIPLAAAALAWRRVSNSNARPANASTVSQPKVAV